MATRKRFEVCTVSDHRWQSTAHTVGSGSETVGSGVGLCIWPRNRSTGGAADRAVACARFEGGEVPTGCAVADAPVVAELKAAATEAAASATFFQPVTADLHT